MASFYNVPDERAAYGQGTTKSANMQPKSENLVSEFVSLSARVQAQSIAGIGDSGETKGMRCKAALE
jgi:hypothetical protein